MKKYSIYWLFTTAVITIIIGFTHIAIQQDLRQSANDPQIDIAESVASELAAGADPSFLIGNDSQIDIAKELSPFIIVFDGSGTPAASTATLDGKTPEPPVGVFAVAKAKGGNRITWEPQKGVRSAVVIVPYGGTHPGFVLVGRSLREVEIRENNLFLMTLI